MFRFGSVVLRQTWLSVHTSASGRHFIVAPPVSTRALEACHIAGRAFSTRALEACHQAGRASWMQENNPRFMSSLETSEGEDDNPFGLVDEDMANVYKTIMNLLDVNITNKEMHDISAKYFRDLGENNYGKPITIMLLLAKAMNHHLFSDGTLTNTQTKLLAIVELFQVVNVTRDDMLDNTTTRRGIPSAHTLWDPWKVILAGNLVYSICYAEAAKLGPEVNVSLCHMHEATLRGQCMSLIELPDDDLINKVLQTHRYKSALLAKHWSIAFGRAVNAKDSVVETVANFTYNLAFSISILDDIWDFDEDLSKGTLSVPIIFAMRDNPEFEEIILRKLGNNGDLEKAYALLKTSRCLEETRILIRRYNSYAMGYLNQLNDSSYKTAIKTLFQMFMLKIDARAQDTYDLQY